jgi:hypothetical protein
MLQAVHVEMMHAALGGSVSTRALKLMIRRTWGGRHLNQLGATSSFDETPLKSSVTWTTQRSLIRPAVEAGSRRRLAPSALSHLHRISIPTATTSTLDGEPSSGDRRPPDRPLEALLNSPALRSGRINSPRSGHCL